MHASASLPALSRPAPRAAASSGPAMGAEGVLRVVQARLFRRMPWEARQVLERLDADGSHRASTEALKNGLREILMFGMQ